MNKVNKSIMHDLHLAQLKAKYPSTPEAYLPIKKYNDNSANALTKCIIDFLTLSGYQAERINTMGRYVDDSKIITDVVGFQRKIGSGKYIKGTGTKGSADISAVVPIKLSDGKKVGLSFKIEVKWSKSDRQSEYQKSYQKMIQEQGGIYMIAKTFDDWIEDFKEILKQYQ